MLNAMKLLRSRKGFGLVSVKELDTLAAYLKKNHSNGKELTNSQIAKIMGR